MTELQRQLKEHHSQVAINLKAIRENLNLYGTQMSNIIEKGQATYANKEMGKTALKPEEAQAIINTVKARGYDININDLIEKNYEQINEIFEDGRGSNQTPDLDISNENKVNWIYYTIGLVGLGVIIFIIL